VHESQPGEYTRGCDCTFVYNCEDCLRGIEVPEHEFRGLVSVMNFEMSRQLAIWVDNLYYWGDIIGYVKATVKRSYGDSCCMAVWIPIAHDHHKYNVMASRAGKAVIT